MKKILEVEGLEIEFQNKKRSVQAVSDVSFHLGKGEVLGIVGESGCGKSITALSLMGLLPKSAAVKCKTFRFKEQDVQINNDHEMEGLRGKKLSVIFQEPMTSLNPLMKVGHQITEMFMRHESQTKRAAKLKTLTMMKKVGLQNVASLYHAYPHSLSGGMAQRIMIAMAMACQPDILIADEPTTALDVTIQAQILSLMKTINEKNKTSIVFISHDFGVIRAICDRVLVMYLGLILESGSVQELLEKPYHPYTVGLLNAIPNPAKKNERLFSIQGRVPSIDKRPEGCPFAKRCYKSQDKCFETLPELVKMINSRMIRCFFPEIEEGEVDE